MLKQKFEKTQMHDKSRLCGETYEMINHIIIESSRLAEKEFKTK